MGFSTNMAQEPIEYRGFLIYQPNPEYVLCAVTAKKGETPDHLLGKLWQDRVEAKKQVDSYLSSLE